MLNLRSLEFEDGLNQEVNVRNSLSSCLHSSKDTLVCYTMTDMISGALLGL